jgi:hypothetical protein
MGLIPKGLLLCEESLSKYGKDIQNIIELDLKTIRPDLEKVMMGIEHGLDKDKLLLFGNKERKREEPWLGDIKYTAPKHTALKKRTAPEDYL